MGVNKQTLRFYWAQVRHHKPSFFIALFLIPTGVLCIDTLLPYIASQAIGAMTVRDADAVTNFVIWAAITGLIGATCNFVGFQMLIHHEANVMVRVLNSAFSSIMNKDMSFFANQKVGAMTSKIIDFTRVEVTLQDLFIVRTLGFVLTVITGIGILAIKMWPLAVIVSVFLAMLLIQVKWSLHHRKYWRTIRREIRAQTHGDLADAFTNNLIVKTFARERDEISHITDLNAQYKHAHIKDVGFVIKEGSVRVFLMAAVQVIAMILCARFVLIDQMEIAVAVFVLAYMQRLGSQLFTLGEMLNGYDQALLDAAPMTKMLMHKDVVRDRDNARAIRDATPTITFEGVSYHYSDTSTNVIENITLEIPAGQKIGLVGHSGAGKTTITHLLLRFDDVTNGSIKIGGHDVRDFTQESLRQNIAYVPQDPMLFHRSLRENIAYSKPNATDSEIREAAQKAYSLDFIDALPHGLDTIVGERGVKLSGGQRQRIAIARAILKNAPILMLDEATSALDSNSEQYIQKALFELMKGRTSLVIAHRLSTIAKLDRIVVLENGRVAEDGTHTKLIAQKGIYAELWKHQSGGFIEG